MPTGLSFWWLGLCTVSVINIGLLARFWIKHLKKAPIPSGKAYALQRRQLWLSTFFVLGCAFRSFLPRADVRRITLVDSWLSSILVGRTVATIAELCFVAQWASLLEAFARPTRLDRITTFSKLIVPGILMAEVFSVFHWRQTHDPKDWEGEIVWMVIYFSLAVWVSLALTQAPIDSLEEGLASPGISPAEM